MSEQLLLPPLTLFSAHFSKVPLALEALRSRLLEGPGFVLGTFSFFIVFPFPPSFCLSIVFVSTL